jgi:hypothetical protein
MKTFVKNFIGKAKKVNNLDIVQVTLNIEKIEDFIFEYEGKRYLKFEVAMRQSPDNYGNTHSVYVNQLVQNPDDNTDVAIRTKKTTRKKRS